MPAGAKGFKSSVQGTQAEFSVVEGFHDSTVLITGATGASATLSLNVLQDKILEAKIINSSYAANRP